MCAEIRALCQCVFFPRSMSSVFSRSLSVCFQVRVVWERECMRCVCSLTCWLLSFCVCVCVFSNSLVSLIFCRLHSTSIRLGRAQRTKNHCARRHAAPAAEQKYDGADAAFRDGRAQPMLHINPECHSRRRGSYTGWQRTSNRRISAR